MAKKTMNYQSHNPKKQLGDRFVWVAYSDLSTMLMLCFMLIFIVLAVINHRKTQESKALKDFVDATVTRKEAILDKLEVVTKEVKNSHQCKDTLWNVDRERNAVQVYFKKNGEKREWFHVGDDELTQDGRKCVSLFSKRWLSTIYLDPLKSQISQLIVEGHTDSQRIQRSDCLDNDGSDRNNFLCNLELSQKRSLSTVKFIFNDVSKDKFHGSTIESEWDQFFEWRKQRLTATGRSFAEPIYAEDINGNITNIEDKNRSRRVEFRFSIEGLLDRKTAMNETKI